MLGSIELRLSGAAKEIVPMPKGSPESSGMSFADYLKNSNRDVYDPFEQRQNAVARQKESKPAGADATTNTGKSDGRAADQASTEREAEASGSEISRRTDSSVDDSKRAQKAKNSQATQADARLAEQGSQVPGGQIKPGRGSEAESAKLQSKAEASEAKVDNTLPQDGAKPESDGEVSPTALTPKESAKERAEIATEKTREKILAQGPQPERASQSEASSAPQEDPDQAAQAPPVVDRVALSADQVRSASPLQQGQSPETLAALRSELPESGTQVIQVIDLRTASGRLQALRQELRGEARVETRAGTAQLVQGTQASTPIGPSNSLNTSAFALEQFAAQDSEIAERLTQNLRLGPFYGTSGTAVHSFLGGALPFNAGLLRLWGQAGGLGPNHQNPTSQEADMEPGTVESAQQVQRLQVEARAVQAQTGAGSAQANLQEFLKTSGAFEIVRSAKFILKDNDRGQIKLILKPENLGEVRIDIQLDNNRIGGTILVDNKEVEEAFLQTLEDLKAAFVSNGFESPVFQIENREAGNSSPVDRLLDGERMGEPDRETKSFLNYGIDLAV